MEDAIDSIKLDDASADVGTTADENDMAGVQFKYPDYYRMSPWAAGKKKMTATNYIEIKQQKRLLRQTRKQKMAKLILYKNNRQSAGEKGCNRPLCNIIIFLLFTILHFNCRASYEQADGLLLW